MAALRYTIGFLFLLFILTAVAMAVFQEVPLGPQYPDYDSCENCSVVVMSFDTLRADHVSYYGPAENTTPNIDRLAEESLVFKRAFGNSGHTFTGAFSTFTSLYPSQHAIVPRVEEKMEKTGEFVTLPQVMREHGYATIGITDGGNMEGELGFRRGFDVYMDKRKKPEADLDRLGKALEERDGERFFLYYQSFITHDPYLPPENYTKGLEGFSPELNQEFLEKKESLKNSSLTGDEKYRILSEYYIERAKENRTVRRHYRAAYTAEVRRADAVVRRLMSLLEERGLRNETVVVLTSQHGEALGEHGYWGHYKSLYNEVLHVPLIIDMPGEEPYDSSAYVSLVDLAPTVLESAGIQNMSFKRQSEGHSLLPPEGLESDDFVLAEGPNFKRKALVAADRDLKYYRDPWRDISAVYDLVEDWDEENQLRDKDTRKRMKELLVDVMEMLESSDASEKTSNRTAPYFAVS